MKSFVYKRKKKKDWYRLKRYLHIGMPLEPRDRKWIEPYVKNEKAVEKHAFFPFIHRTMIVRKFRKEVCHDGTRSKLRKPDSKTRHIYFSNHLDANIFSYYSEKLSKEYEKVIAELNIGNYVTAYRKIKLEPDKKKGRNKCNIDFANDVFQFIKTQKGQDLVAVTFDITSFFDNLDHSLLKKQWKRVIKADINLPKDHYKVFRNITKFSYIEEWELFEKFKTKIIVKKAQNKIMKKSIKKPSYFRNQKAVAYCDTESIKEIRELGLIKANKYVNEDGEVRLRKKGIPQGSPISATLANIYMIDFDKKVGDFLHDLGGVYQRYSDDMVAVCPIENEQQVIDHFLSSIQEFKLEIQKSKTQVFHFLFDDKADRHFCYEKNLNTGHIQNNTLFEYLGFQFDGQYTLIKNSSISNYYRKMKKSFSRSAFYAYHNRTATNGEIFKRRLYKKFTDVGAERRRMYKRHPHKTNVFIRTHKQDWGNFLSYANLAKKVMPNNKIGQQIKRNWRKFHELMRKIERKNL